MQGRRIEDHSGCDPSKSQRPFSTLGRWLIGQRVRPMWMLLAALMLLFGLERGVLAILKGPVLGDVPPRAVARLFVVGFWQDFRVLGFFVLPLTPLLTLAPNRAFSRKWLKSIVAWYIAGVLALAAAVCLIDAMFFMAGNARLNWQLPSYVGEGEILMHVWSHYPVIALSLGMAALIAAAAYFARRCCLGGPPPAGPAWPRVVGGAAMAVLVLWIAWPTDEPTPGSSVAHFPSNLLISQLAFNPLATGSVAVKEFFTEGDMEPEHYRLLTVSEAFGAAREVLGQNHTTFGGRTDNPLWRTVRTARPRRDMNVVIIVMESFAGRHVGALGNEPSQTPFFDALAAKGTFFTQMYASGPRTSRGLAAILCGFPDLGGKSVLERTRSQGSFQSLFGLFAQRGYDTSFFYGGDANFDNMRAFFTSVGLQRMVDIEHMPPDVWRTDWGVADHVVFDKAHETFEAADAPFFSVVLTLTNHNPHLTPPGTIAPLQHDTPEARIAHTTRYADWALERFFNHAAASEYYADTLFVLVADHGAKFDPRPLVDVAGYRTPCLFYAPAMAELAARKISVPCSQTDAPTTVLAAIGGEYAHGMFGRDMLVVEPADPGLALLRNDRYMALVRGDLALIELPERDPLLFRRPPGDDLEELPPGTRPAAAADMHRTAMGLYQSARQLYLSRAYGRS